MVQSCMVPMHYLLAFCWVLRLMLTRTKLNTSTIITKTNTVISPYTHTMFCCLSKGVSGEIEVTKFLTGIVEWILYIMCVEWSSFVTIEVIFIAELRDSEVHCISWEIVDVGSSAHIGVDNRFSIVHERSFMISPTATCLLGEDCNRWLLSDTVRTIWHE